MPVSNPLSDAIILRNGLMRHHKVTYVVGKGILRMALIGCGQFRMLKTPLNKPKIPGLFFKAPQIYIDEVFAVSEHMPDCNKDFAGDSHHHFHFCFVPLCALHIGEVGEEAVSGS